ncbi:MAG: aromatic amino acid lyase, partial [Rubrobacteraceae bacterium]
GRKLRKVLDNLSRILAVEAVCAAQALDLRAPLKPAPATGAVHRRIRRDIPFIEEDEFLAPHLRSAEELVRSGAMVEAVEGLVELE